MAAGMDHEGQLTKAGEYIRAGKKTPRVRREWREPPPDRTIRKARPLEPTALAIGYA